MFTNPQSKIFSMLLPIAVFFITSCRSGHFENRHFQDTTHIQVKILSSDNQGECGSAYCARLQLQAFTDKTPLANQELEVSLSQTDLQSPSSELKLTDSQGEFALDLEFTRREAQTAPEVHLLITFSTKYWGKETYLAILKFQNPKMEFLTWDVDRNQSKAQTIYPRSDLQFENQGVFVVDRKNTDPLISKWSLQQLVRIRNSRGSCAPGARFSYKLKSLRTSNLLIEAEATTTADCLLELPFEIDTKPLEKGEIHEVLVQIFEAGSQTKLLDGWVLSLDFDHHPLQPLIHLRKARLDVPIYSTASKEPCLQISDPQVALELNTNHPKLDRLWRPLFQDKLRMSWSVSILRWPWGDREPVATKPGALRTRVKVIALDRRVNRVVFEKMITKNLQDDSRLLLEIEDWAPQPDALKEIHFVAALELPDLLYADRLYWTFDARTSRFQMLSRTEAQILAGSSILDLTSQGSSEAPPETPESKGLLGLKKDLKATKVEALNLSPDLVERLSHLDSFESIPSDLAKDLGAFLLGLERSNHLLPFILYRPTELVSEELKTSSTLREGRSFEFRLKANAEWGLVIVNNDASRLWYKSLGAKSFEMEDWIWELGADISGDPLKWKSRWPVEPGLNQEWIQNLAREGYYARALKF